MKRCYNCGEIKPENCFSKHRKNKDGLRCTCKQCDTLYYCSHKIDILKVKKEYNHINKKKRKEYENNYRQNHKQERNQSDRERRNRDPLFKLKQTIRNRINIVFKYNKYPKQLHVHEMLGCSYEELINYLGPKPEGKMSLDHICPCAQAQNEEELIKLQHYTNLKWMALSENCSKNDTWTPEAEEMCHKLLGREWIE